jgi:hypothetical protein
MTPDSPIRQLGDTAPGIVREDAVATLAKAMGQPPQRRTTSLVFRG